MSHDPETQPPAPVRPVVPAPVRPVTVEPTASAPATDPSIPVATPAPVVPASASAVQVVTPAERPDEPTPVRPVPAPQDMADESSQVEPEKYAPDMSLGDALTQPPQAPAALPSEPSLQSSDATPDQAQAEDPPFADPLSSQESDAPNGQAGTTGVQKAPAVRSKLTGFGRRKAAGDSSTTTVIAATPAVQAGSPETQEKRRGKIPGFGRRNAETTTATAMRAPAFQWLKWPQAGKGPVGQSDKETVVEEGSAVHRSARPGRAAALAGLGLLGVLGAALLLRPQPADEVVESSLERQSQPTSRGVPMTSTPAALPEDDRKKTVNTGKTDGADASARNTGPGRQDIATPQDKEENVSINPGVREALVKPDPALANAFVTTGSAEAAQDASEEKDTPPSVEPVRRAAPVVATPTRASTAVEDVPKTSVPAEIATTPAPIIPAPPVRVTVTPQPPKYVPPAATPVVITPATPVVAQKPEPIYITPSRIPATRAQTDAPKPASPKAAPKPAPTKPAASPKPAPTPPALTVLPAPRPLPAPSKTTAPDIVPERVPATKQAQGVPDVVVLPPPTATPPTTTSTGANATQTGTAQAATPTPAEVTVTVMPTVEYLGYASTEAGATAMLRIGGRDEIANEGQEIPGTKVRVLSVTPTSLTIESEAGTKTVPLMETAQ